jgi:Ca2+-binding EF-hand superfamily protein
VVDKTIREADLDGDGRLSFDEFKVFVENRNKDLVDKVTIESAV